MEQSGVLRGFCEDDINTYVHTHIYISLYIYTMIHIYIYVCVFSVDEMMRVLFSRCLGAEDILGVGC